MVKIISLMALIVLTMTVLSAEPGRGKRQSLSGIPPEAWAAAQVILSRPTDQSVTVNIVPPRDMAGTLECNGKTTPFTLKGGIPGELVIDQLQPDQAYTYTLKLADGEEKTFSFQTRRNRTSSFTFALQGDSHPERAHQLDPQLYAKVLSAVAAGKPDFYLLMGDDFSVDTLKNISKSAVENIYAAHRPYLSIIGSSAPLFLVNGNHEQAAKANLDGTPDNVAIWAQNARNRYYSPVVPEDFYDAWHWGDALFVIIDPYWHSDQAVDNKFGSRDKNPEPWNATLGDTQYQWLKKTLEDSPAQYKFIFTHHVNGTGRGGVEAASLYEWGGRNRKGVSEFSARRPNWPMPIHELLKANHVTIVFQGHDHIFAHQELDGIIYQTLPLPAGSVDSLENAQAYKSGKTVAGSGFVQVQVTPDGVTVKFISAHNGTILYQYQVK